MLCFELSVLDRSLPKEEREFWRFSSRKTSKFLFRRAGHEAISDVYPVTNQNRYFFVQQATKQGKYDGDERRLRLWVTESRTRRYKK